MFGRRWTLFRLCGFPISLDASWLVILALLTLSIGSEFPELMQQYFGASAPHLQPGVYWILGLVAALAFFCCILLHELGHAIVGRAKGMPIRGITLFLFGGVAELADEPASAGTEFLMAIAGPLVSVALGVVFGILAWIGYHAHWSPPLVLILGLSGGDQSDCVGVQFDPGLSARWRPGAALDSLGRDGRFAPGHALGGFRRASVRLAADRLGRVAILHRQLARRNLDGPDRHVSQ